MTVREEVLKILASRKAAHIRIRCAHWLSWALMLLSVLNSEVPYWMSGSIAQPFWTSIDGLLCSSKVTILWLRRFNTKQGNDRYLLRFIAQACKGMGAVVTLQDSQFDKVSDS